MRKFISVFVLLALLLSTGTGVVLAQGPLPPEEANANRTASPPVTITPEIVKQAARLAQTGEQVVLGSTWGDTQYWFTCTWSSNDPGVTDYESWNFFKIDGREDLFYVEEVGSAYDKYSNLRSFEPWIRSNTSDARLIDWDPAGQVVVNPDGQTVTFSLSFGGTGISTSFAASKETYNPYAWSTHYSVEWRGDKPANTTVGNKYVTRWHNGPPWGMQMAACGWWDFYGNCSNRDHP